MKVWNDDKWNMRRWQCCCSWGNCKQISQGVCSYFWQGQPRDLISKDIALVEARHLLFVILSDNAEFLISCDTTVSCNSALQDPGPASPVVSEMPVKREAQKESIIFHNSLITSQAANKPDISFVPKTVHYPEVSFMHQLTYHCI